MDLYTIGSFHYLACVIIANLRLFFVSGEITIYSAGIIILSIICYFLVLLYMNSRVSYDNFGTLYSMFEGNFDSWLVLLLACTSSLLIDVFIAKIYWLIRTRKIVSS
mmetsp:Transcript_5575/g.5742  ORF Transcript_5575/g.5742 Transcript_5575/m.5742 type:complete len:107 (-) Transcript_5575:8-328(-)